MLFLKPEARGMIVCHRAWCEGIWGHIACWNSVAVPWAGGASAGVVYIHVLSPEQTNLLATLCLFPGGTSWLSLEWSLRVSQFGNETKIDHLPQGRGIPAFWGMKLMEQLLARIKLLSYNRRVCVFSKRAKLKLTVSLLTKLFYNIDDTRKCLLFS